MWRRSRDASKAERDSWRRAPLNSTTTVIAGLVPAIHGDARHLSFPERPGAAARWILVSSTRMTVREVATIARRQQGEELPGVTHLSIPPQLSLPGLSRQ